MRKFRTLLTLIMVSVCAVQSAWARIAPTLPEAQTLESGNIYYLYNVGSDRFLTFDKSNYYACATSNAGLPVKLALYNGTQYTIEFPDDGRYLYYPNNQYVEARTASSPSYTDYRFTITETEGGYTIQRVYNSVETEFIGFNGSDGDRLKANLTEGNIVWQLMDPDEAARFIAKRNLYRALESSNGYGYNVDKYEAIYESELSTNYALQEAADQLNKALDVSNTVPLASWSDYKILFEMDVNKPWYYYSSSYSYYNYDGGYFSSYYHSNASQSLNATIEVDDDATLTFRCGDTQSSGKAMMEVYLDGYLVQTINRFESCVFNDRYFVELTPGKHSIKWKFINNYSDYASYIIHNIGVERTPTMTVSLREPGSLGTEVLAQTDHVANVRKLVVSGEMNQDDWDRIVMMTSLYSLDLTNAVVTNIPDNQLSYTKYSALSFLHEVKLPTTLETIGKSAFSGTNLDAINFPDGLTTIGAYAFRATHIQQALLPETVTMVGEYAFDANHSLTTVSWPAAAQSIPNYCFNECNVMQPFTIPEGIQQVGNYAFNYCYSFASALPSTLSSIGTYAFENSGMQQAVVPEGCSVGTYAFRNCRQLTYVELPTTFYNEVDFLLAKCANLQDVYFKSPTMVTASQKTLFNNDTQAGINLHVPLYLVNAYKQDNYWYNCNVVGFNTSDITYWQIANALTLKDGDRLEGGPDIYLLTTGSVEINGDQSMTIKDLKTNSNPRGYYTYRSNGTLYNNVDSKYINYAKIISHTDNISITGDYTARYATKEKEWYFISLPFDLKVSDIIPPTGASYACRYYDGATRAENGASGNWKNYSKDDIIEAGTGFIYQTSKAGYTTFKAQNNESKQYAFSNKMFVKALNYYASENKEDRGWNLVGNPWQAYYNIHKLNFTAPITVWNVANRNYTAYSLIDDDYAIRPNEAFFVQCPNDMLTTIEFPTDGRQLTDVIESQNASRSSEASTRKLIDVELTDGNMSDKTRLVVNAQASMDYETSCDASKFFSFDGAVPQIFSYDDEGIQYAINERPMSNGVLRLGVTIQQAGEYTIKALRNDMKNVVLVDRITGRETNLSMSDYTFHAEVGTNYNRFYLTFGAVTGIRAIENLKDVQTEVYSLDGRKLGTSTEGLSKGIYVVRTGQKTKKVMVQ